ncbi:MAG: AbrB/MazE/SpoVT family DNA-binding domain-containing protein [Methanosarcinaceae archaeon]|nr:AbrB/MazE/SpoVT family DNA-binding domain-containing protein [Methanosarcinaceae archaeon]
MKINKFGDEFVIIRKVQSLTNCKNIVIPAKFCDAMGINRGTYMSFERDGNSIGMTPVATTSCRTHATGCGKQPFEKRSCPND